MSPENPKPRVSIIVPTYNRGYCIAEAIQSVREQTWTDWELIVLDDGSTDETAAVLRRFPDIRTIALPRNAGVSRARNRGIQEARGAYIGFLDSDDLWRPRKLETQLEWMEAHPECRVCYTDEIWIRRGVRVNPMRKHQKRSGDIFPFCLPLCIVSPSSVLMRASLVREVGGFDESLPACEDYDLWLRIASRYCVHWVEEKLIVKRGGHPDQLSARYWGMDGFRVYALEKILQEGHLDEERIRLVLQELVKKCRILAQGFAKRGKRAEEDFYRSRMQRYEQWKILGPPFPIPEEKPERIGSLPGWNREKESGEPR